MSSIKRPLEEPSSFPPPPHSVPVFPSNHLPEGHPGSPTPNEGNGDSRPSKIPRHDAPSSSGFGAHANESESEHGVRGGVTLEQRPNLQQRVPSPGSSAYRRYPPSSPADSSLLAEAQVQLAPPIVASAPPISQVAPPIVKSSLNTLTPTAPPLIPQPKALSAAAASGTVASLVSGSRSVVMSSGGYGGGIGTLGQSGQGAFGVVRPIGGGPSMSGLGAKVKEEPGLKVQVPESSKPETKTFESMREKDNLKVMAVEKVWKEDREEKRVREDKEKDLKKGDEAERSKGREKEESEDMIEFSPLISNVPSAVRSNRVLRPRGQQSSREPRLRASGRSEVPWLQYREGEGGGIPDKYKHAVEAKDGGEGNQHHSLVEIRIPAEAVTSTNSQVVARHLWGTDIYTDDSDIVAVLMHTGYYTPTASGPPPMIQELRATLRILPAQECYLSSLRNSMRSRSWGAARGGSSYSVDKCRIIKVGGGSVELEPCPMRTPVVAPTLAPASQERTVTTRAASQSAYRGRFTPEVTVLYNLCNEPWQKYSMHIVADRGLKPSQFTSARLMKGEVLYVETPKNRYELAYEDPTTAAAHAGGEAAAQGHLKGEDGEKGNEGDKERDGREGGREEREKETGGKGGGSTHGEGCAQHWPDEPKYTWSCCKPPLPLSAMRTVGVPLPSEMVRVVEQSLDWEELQWTSSNVWIRGKEYPLVRAQWMPRKVIEQ